MFLLRSQDLYQELPTRVGISESLALPGEASGTAWGYFSGTELGSGICPPPSASILSLLQSKAPLLNLTKFSKELIISFSSPECPTWVNSPS